MTQTYEDCLSRVQRLTESCRLFDLDREAIAAVLSRNAELEAENVRLRAVEAWDAAMFAAFSKGAAIDLTGRPDTKGNQ